MIPFQKHMRSSVLISSKRPVSSCRVSCQVRSLACVRRSMHSAMISEFEITLVLNRDRSESHAQLSKSDVVCPSSTCRGSRDFQCSAAPCGSPLAPNASINIPVQICACHPPSLILSLQNTNSSFWAFADRKAFASSSQTSLRLWGLQFSTLAFQYLIVRRCSAETCGSITSLRFATDDFFSTSVSQERLDEFVLLI